MRSYWALFAARARTLLQYRAAAFAGLVTQWVFGFVMISVMIAFYEQTSVPQPMTLAQVITYTWIGQAMLGFLPWNADAETIDSIRMGTVAYDLTRPIDLYTHWYARVVALRVAPTLLKSIPMFIIATFVMPSEYAMRWPAFSTVLVWFASLMGMLLLSCSFTVILQTTVLWMVRGEGIMRIMPHFVTLFSGMVIPLPLFPGWMQSFLQYQPFAGLSFPSLLLSGSMPVTMIGQVLLLQVFWSVCFIVFGRWMMRRGLRRLTVAGG